MNRERKRTCDLEAFKAAFSDPGRLAITGTALKSAAAMGFGRPDVYHVPSAVGLLYVKFTADTVTESLLLSFKEKNNE
ncbi:MAG: hypothetical protein A4E60_01966 [Syntrophorhabdus sp. PtaB.Bin047]|jgi:motility quorum-sensing regulator/GCU-specific mRNA interferase toxin|nr:MAG: hypothetical protein A4E60_01966 [Syntrophorhabdus sp. PtaB.Bin047]HOD72449.1 type II toxin-antitoxin system MqsR family toxin [Deltaproteobacteria bacterium]